MNRTSVTSSNIASVGFDAVAGILEVEFKNGGLYQYFDVPASVFEDLIATDRARRSVGSYFDVYVKKAGYRYVEL